MFNWKFLADNNGNKVLSDVCTVKPTISTNEEYSIELEDGSIIKCTASHRFMLKDGSYKMAKDLTEEDELFDSNAEPFGYIEKFCEKCPDEYKKGRLKRMKIKSIRSYRLDEPKEYYDVINADPYNNFLIKTNKGAIVSHNCFFDEIN